MSGMVKQDHRIDLKISAKRVGEIYPILRDAKGECIDGLHRLDVNSDWHSITLENVKTKEDRLIVSAHVNLGRRKISRLEKRRIVNELAEIYFIAGLRPDSFMMGKVGRGKDPDKLQRRNHNEIKHKIFEVLGGVISLTQVKYYLEPKYLNQVVGEGNKRYYEGRRNNMSAYSLLLSSHGKVLRETYGENFFDRLKDEMMLKALKKAKTLLRQDRRFRKEIEKEVKKVYDANIRIIMKEFEDNLRAEIREEMKLEPSMVVAL
ncbi:hypothetical protein ES703_90453 [subsurface metagenome]